MHNLSIRRTSDLLPSARTALESLLGRDLEDDEEIGIWASRPHPAPEGDARKKGWASLNQHLDAMASKAAAESVGELEELADQAADDVRHGRG